MTVNVDNMGIFKDVSGTGDTIVNLSRSNDKGAVKTQLVSNGSYRQYNVFRGVRSQKTVKANRDVREALLNNLRTTFGLQNDTKYMSKLSLILGNDVLKSEDFDADANGRVHTDCPLTERRISAIVGRVKELADAPALCRKICDAAMTEKARAEFVAGVKKGNFGTAEALTKFIARHFDGEIRRQAVGMMAVPGANREALCRLIAATMLQSLVPALIQGGVTRAQLKAVCDAVSSFAGAASSADALSGTLAQELLKQLKPMEEVIAKASLNTRLDSQKQKLSSIKYEEKQGQFSKLMRSEHGRDILVQMAREALSNLAELQGKGFRPKVDGLLLKLAVNVKKLGPEQAYLFVDAVCRLSDNPNGYFGVTHMQQRELLGTVLKQYTDLSDADLKQIPFAELKDFARAAIDDSLETDREAILEKMKETAQSMRDKNYTDAEARELLEFAHELKDFKPDEPVEAGQVEVPPGIGQGVKSDANKVVCDAMTLLGKLLHREDVWTTDALTGPQAIMDTLQRNGELVKSLSDGWNDPKTKMESLSGLPTLVLGCLGFSGPDFSDAIKVINQQIVRYAAAQTDEERRGCCEAIDAKVNALIAGLFPGLQKVLTKNLDTLFKGMGLCASFEGLPDGENLETADLLKLAETRHPKPKHETAAQRRQREAAILAEYSQLVASPQAGGLGKLIRSLATNYVSELDDRQKRAMLSGVLQSVTPELLTKLLKGKSASDFCVDSDNLVQTVSTLLSEDGRRELLDRVDLKDGDGLSSTAQEMAGAAVSGLLKGAGPVFQKIVQMIGAEKVPSFLRQAVKDCKSRLKPIPPEYVKAKLAEIVRRSNGQITKISNPTSIGSASIAQAFKCKLTYKSGETRDVVIKMMRPDVRGRMEREIAAIRKSVAGAGEGALKTLNARISSLLGELDFTEERANIEHCQPIYGNTIYSCLRSVKLAKDCPQLPDVLVMDLAQGQTFQDYIDATAEKLDKELAGKVTKDKAGHFQLTPMKAEVRQELTTSLTKTYQDVRKRQANLQRLMQTWFSNAIFGDGKFHGDLHAGNVMVDENGQLTVIDFGNAPTFAEKDRKNVVKLLVAAARGEPDSVLAAVRQLVSADSRELLAEQFDDLRKRLDKAFAIGDESAVVERLAIVFGELTRKGIEVPESLYNFVDAFGRMQQLSSSMTKTLERISSALPYLREHLGDGNPDVALTTLPKSLKYKSMDVLIDEMLTNHIEKLRKDEPSITDAEIFKRLREESERGRFDNIFGSLSKNDNPIIGNVIEFGSLLIDCQNMLFGVTDFPDDTEVEAFKNYAGKDEATRDPKDKPGYDHACRYSASMTEKVLARIEAFFGPYCQLDPKLGPRIEELKDLMKVRYSPEYLLLNPGLFDYAITKDVLADPEKAFDADQYIDLFIGKKNVIVLEGQTVDDVKKKIADISIKIRKIFCQDILPSVVGSFKTRMGQVISSSDMSKFPPPVSIKSSIGSSVLWHIPKMLDLGGSDMVGLLLKAAWKGLTDKSVVIRANFNVPLADFRSFASSSVGCIHMTEKKRLEPLASQKKLTVQNAEAWRALAESLMADMQLTEEQFYRSRTWEKIAAIFELGKGENFFNVESAGNLTPETLQRILAVRDMDKLYRSQPPLQEITAFFQNGPMVEDTTFKDFNEKLSAAFAEEFTSSVSDKLGIGKETLDAFFKANYGKVIARMSEIGADDPYCHMSGQKPRPQDLRRWLIAATLDTLKNAGLGEKAKLSLEAVFDRKIRDVRAEARKKEPFATGGGARVLTAILLHQGWTDGDQDEVAKLLEFCTNESKEELGQEVPLRDSSYFERKNNTWEQDVQKKSSLYSDVTDPEWKKKLKVEADKLGLGMAKIAADQGLYDRFAALRGLKEGAEYDKLLADLSVRVAKSMYFTGLDAKLVKDDEIAKIVNFWEKKIAYGFEKKPLAGKAVDVVASLGMRVWNFFHTGD